MNRLLILGMVACFLTACGLAPGAVEPVGDRSATVTIRPLRQVQATAHRWQAADIYQYELTLQVWNGTTFLPLSPTVKLVLPQKTSQPASQGTFVRLKQGFLYRAVVTALGNAGGTAPTGSLNSETETTAMFDFRGSQNVPETLSESVQVQLDAVPFSGTATVVPQFIPLNTQQLDLTLNRNGTPVYNRSFGPAQTLVLQDLRVGASYEVYLVARDGVGTPLGEALSDVFHFDPSGQDLEQVATLPVPFSTPAPIQGTIR